LEHLLRRFFLSVNVNSVNNRNETPLHYALTGECDPKVVKILLSHGVNPNAVTSKMETPLSICFKKKFPLEIVELLEVR
jgi:ankyrin repeat protein